MLGFGREMAHALEEPVIVPEEPKGTIFMSVPRHIIYRPEFLQVYCSKSTMCWGRLSPGQLFLVYIVPGPFLSRVQSLSGHIVSEPDFLRADCLSMGCL